MDAAPNARGGPARSRRERRRQRWRVTTTWTRAELLRMVPLVAPRPLVLSLEVALDLQEKTEPLSPMQHENSAASTSATLDGTAATQTPGQPEAPVFTRTQVQAIMEDTQRECLEVCAQKFECKLITVIEDRNRLAQEVEKLQRCLVAERAKADDIHETRSDHPSHDWLMPLERVQLSGVKDPRFSRSFATVLGTEKQNQRYGVCIRDTGQLIRVHRNAVVLCGRKVRLVDDYPEFIFPDDCVAPRLNWYKNEATRCSSCQALFIDTVSAKTHRLRDRQCKAAELLATTRDECFLPRL